MVTFDLLSRKFEGRDTAQWWLETHSNRLRGYVRRIAKPHDWDSFEDYIYNGYPEIGKKIVEDYWKDDEEKLDKVIKEFNSKNGQVWIIVGGRGSGKTLTAMLILEKIQQLTHRECYIAGPPQAMPKKFIRIPDMSDAPQGSVVFVDEASSKYFCRQGMSAGNQQTVLLLNSLRHTGRNVIFATQMLRSTDVLIRTAADVLVVKEQGIFAGDEEKSKRVRSLLSFIKPHGVKETLFWFNDWFTLVRDTPKPKCWKNIYSTPYTAITDEKLALKTAKEYAENIEFINVVEIKKYLALRSFNRPLNWWKNKLLGLEEMGPAQVSEGEKEGVTIVS